MGDPSPAGKKAGGEDIDDDDQTAMTDEGRKASATGDRLIRATLGRMVDEDALAAWRLPIDAAIRKAFGDLDPADPELVAKFRERGPAFLASLPGVVDSPWRARLRGRLAGRSSGGVSQRHPAGRFLAAPGRGQVVAFFNSWHDARGRFASGPGGVPGKADFSRAKGLKTEPMPRAWKKTGGNRAKVLLETYQARGGKDLRHAGLGAVAVTHASMEHSFPISGPPLNTGL